jgi:hypothetical protein
VKSRFQAFAFKWVNLYRYSTGGINAITAIKEPAGGRTIIHSLYSASALF